jgi:hypothetical protein
MCMLQYVCAILLLIGYINCDVKRIITSVKIKFQRQNEDGYMRPKHVAVIQTSTAQNKCTDNYLNKITVCDVNI